MTTAKKQKGFTAYRCNGCGEVTRDDPETMHHGWEHKIVCSVDLDTGDFTFQKCGEWRPGQWVSDA